MKVLITGQFLKGSLEASYYDAFIANGCEVYKFNISDYVNGLLSNRYVKRFLSLFIQKTLNVRLKNKVYEIKPDLLFIIKGDFIYPETLKRLKENKNLKIFNFNPDNPFNKNPAASNDLIRKSIPYYDCYFIWGRFLIPDLIKAGAQHVKYLPFAYDPKLHYPVEVSEAEKERFGSDIAFIGTWDKEREEFLEPLADLDLIIWGNGWEKLKWNSKLKSKLKKRSAIGEEFSKVCNSSKIILNHIRAQNGNAHNMKTFEIPACRGLMLTNRTVEHLEFFDENNEILCFSSVQELKDKINYALKNVAEARKIALNGYNKVQEQTYEKRATEIIRVFNEIGRIG